MSFQFTNGNIYSAYEDTGPGFIVVHPLATVRTVAGQTDLLSLFSGDWDVIVNGKPTASNGTVIALKDAGSFHSQIQIGPAALISAGGTFGYGINAAHAANVNNAGSIKASHTGINESGDGDFSIINQATGLIEGQRYGIHVSFSGTHFIFNAGNISGGEYAVLGETGNERVTNVGTLQGNVHLGDGDDLYDGAGGRLTGKAFGGNGNDTISGGIDNDWFEGGNNNDTLSGNGGRDTLLGQDGNDVLDGGAGDDILDGGAGNDTLRGGAGKDALTGGDGNDTFVVSGKHGVGDSFNGGTGIDKMQVVGTGSATLAGFNATASSIEQWQGNGKGLLGTSANNKFDFSGLTAKSGLPFVDGAGGNDTIIGSNFADTLRGGKGNDKLNGGAGNDKLDGGKGIDKLDGGAGNDVLTGGLGKDILTGALGKDRFDFNSIKESVKGSSRDQIKDFKHSQGDRIDLKGIDANTKKGGNQKFKFIGDDKFSKKPGELRFDKKVVQGDVNGDGKADFEIHVDVNKLVSGDFIL